MKIILAVQELNVRGGTHKQVLRLGQYLKNSGHDVAIVAKFVNLEATYQDFREFVILAGTKRRDRPHGRIFRAAISFVASWRMVRLVRFDCDAINIHDNGFGFFYLFLKMSGFRKKVVWQINDLPVCFKVGPNSSTIERPWFAINRLFFRWMARSVNVITVNVTKNRERVENAMGSTAKVLYCGVDLACSSFAPRANGPRQHVELLSIGVFFPYRNYETILESQMILWDEHRISSELTIVGSTHLSPEYAEAIRSLAKKWVVNCRILGEIEEGTLRKCFLENDIFVFVNIDQSWGLSVFEAMNAGLPVIVSESIGAVELLRDGSDAEIVDPRSAREIVARVAKLCSRGELYADRSRTGFKTAQGMTWEKLYCRPMELILSKT